MKATLPKAEAKEEKAMNIERIANQVKQIAAEMKNGGIAGIMLGYNGDSIQLDYSRFLELYAGKDVFEKRTPGGYIELYVIFDGIKINAVTRAEPDPEPETRIITIPEYHRKDSTNE